MKNWVKKNKYWMLLMAFIICVFIYTVLGRPEQISDNRMNLFWSYREFIVNGNYLLFREILLNIVMFIPVGYMLACALESKCRNIVKILFSALLGLLLSANIEFCQYFFFKGTAEADDIFNNTLGAIIGCVAFIVLKKIKIKRLDISKFSFCISICCIVVAIAFCIGMDRTTDTIVRQLAFQASNAKVEDGKLIVDGFCFTYGYDLMDPEAKKIDVFWDDTDYDILLKSTKSGRIYPMKITTNIKNETINDYFRSVCEYPRTGYKASIDIDELNSSDEYEVLLKSGRLTISGKTYIKDFNIEKTPNIENVSLNVNGTYLEDVVEKGYLKAHNKDNSCVVYQYGMYLFWIANEEFEFDINGTTKLYYQIWTNQLNKVPTYGEEKPIYWDNRSFNFEEKEVTKKIKCGRYRVAMMELPTEYAIAFITVGTYGDGILEWTENFRPRY